MTRVLPDTNVVLDVLLDRHPWNVIVTRDPAGFAGSTVEVIAPADLLNRLNAGS
jgi:hypothetical protein